MIAAGFSDPRLVRLVRGGDLGLPLASGLRILFRIFGYFVCTLGSSRRTPTVWRRNAGAGLLGISGVLHIEAW